MRIINAESINRYTIRYTSKYAAQTSVTRSIFSSATTAYDCQGNTCDIPKSMKDEVVNHNIYWHGDAYSAGEHISNPSQSDLFKWAWIRR